MGMASRALRGVGWAVWSVLRVAWISTMVLTPLFGFWLASSLAAYDNASQWLALLVGLALFPIVPVCWDLIFVWRRNRRPPRKAILTRLDRLVLRTLIVNGLFLGGMIGFAPQTAFRAIAVRGDWMLDGFDGDLANGVREAILGFADHFERRWHKTDDEYGHSDKAPEPVAPADKPKPGPDATAPVPGWPVSSAPEAAVTEMPATEQASIDAVGRYLAAHVPDKLRLVKAIHDYVALRLHYDEDALAKILAKDYAHTPSQEAEPVFLARAGVCEGYAKLMSALGKAAGVEIAYVTGYIRDTRRRTTDTGTDDAIKAALEGYSHAWNVAHVGDKWLLVDATWDDPKDPAAPIRSTYLFTPPELFIRDHLPELPGWQLLAKPLSPGEFARQPFLTPFAGTLGLALESPTRSQVTVDGDLAIVLANPRGALLSATFRVDGSTARGDHRCTTRPLTGARTEIACHLGTGQFEIQMFGAPAAVVHAEGGSYTLDYIGSILANSH